MRSIHPLRTLLARTFLTACSLLHVGCIGSSPPSRFYLLSPLSSSDSTIQVVKYETIVAMSKIQLPIHLDRPQIVTRDGPNSLVLAEFDRWAEPLSDNFTRILIRNLEDLLLEQRVFMTSWRGGMKSDYRIFLETTRFDIEADRVVLDAIWGLLGGPDDTVVLKRRSLVREGIEGEEEDYAAKVAALSRALGVLSQEIATGIKDTLNASATN